MSLLETGFVSLGCVLALIALRVPIGIVLLTVSFGGVWAGLGFNVAWGLSRAIPFEIIANWSFSAVPMFLLMGFVASNCGLTRGMFAALRILLRRLPGGLACSGVAASAMFAAASGSSLATAGAMSRIAIPEMLRAGYDKSLAAGSIAAAGTLGSLIPPSLLMIIFAIFAQVSVGKLFLAGFLPGLLSTFMYMLLIVVRCRLRPDLAPAIDFEPTREDKIAAIRDVWPLPLLVLGVLGGIFAGIMTPTEAGAVGASLALLIALFRRSLTLDVLKKSIRDTVFGTSTIFVIVIGASLFTSFMGMSGVPRAISSVMAEIAGDNVVLLVLMIAVVYILMGMFIDSIGIMLLTLPIFFPLLQQANVDMIWFGIIVIKLLEIGLVTPPVGLNCYVMASALKGTISLQRIFQGASYFILMDIVTLVLLVLFPAISLYLPSLMR
ncbi:TRAP transporter large permease subunit [Salipiger sp. P9]|uniref:TRAP transporter large permease n=1 Tax=Salipiger pentaromativorans TaxID=2943193 RepID=UPI0021572985|nr:TRAP transporter large permease subunit [Salipiger pentaromativorans]MCR8547821.1 TRAP transporter large permease subunit [Salipiger pentaromativorans]